MKRIKKVGIVALLLVMTVMPVKVFSSDLGDILKSGALILGGGAVIQAIAGPINDFINTVTFNRGGKLDGYTKVVPIVSLGSGTHIGAAQVGGNKKSAVDNTEAVAQLEADFKGIRTKVLIPIDSVNPVKQFRRVQGVGVTAIIDIKI